MQTYNKSLDFVVLAMATGRQGNVQKAAKLFAKALEAPDAVRAIQILEASNKQAFSKTQAAQKTTAAAKRVQAGEFDIGDDADLDDLVESSDGSDDVDDLVEAADEDEDDEDFTEQFASVLASMSKKGRK